MTVGNRKKLEVALGKSCAHILAGEGYKLTESKDLQRLSKSNDFVEWHFLFYLTDNAPYGIFSKSAVVYLDATNKIKNLLSETGLFSQYQVGISQSSGKHCGTLVGKKISPSDDIQGVAQMICREIKCSEEKYLAPYSDIKKTVELAESPRPQKWPADGMAINMCIIIGYGLSTNNHERIVFGIKRALKIIEESSCYVSAPEINIIEAIKEKLLEKKIITQEELRQYP